MLYEQLYRLYHIKDIEVGIYIYIKGRDPMSYWDMWQQSYHHLALTFVQGQVDEEVFGIVEKLEEGGGSSSGPKTEMDFGEV